MKFIDEKVASIMNEKYAKDVERYNKRWQEQSFFSVGDKVWYRRPEKAGTNSTVGDWVPRWSPVGRASIVTSFRSSLKYA